MVLVKDNHLKAAGGVVAAIRAVRRLSPDMTIEVEADSVEQAREAAREGADMVLLDNMDDATIVRAVSAVREEADLRGPACLTEASGGITFERLASLRTMLLDRVSTSAITLAEPIDFGLDQATDLP